MRPPGAGGVTAGVDTGKRRAPARVRGDLRADGADRRQDGVGAELAAVREADGTDTPVLPGADSRHRRAELESDAVGAVALGDEVSDLPPEHALERCLSAVHERDAHAERAGRRSDLAADEAGADDREPPSGLELLAQG